ncbi:hypothetical protein PROFUN_16348 [Planoprotostelium fungivorum]|uniref:RNase H type-1 domain-containing protein n=1 Tax=Planoprotostelium fungivorum TaxID=1890364 RepID=A0A2P6MQL7_9EUKA|nr:hypothetical protein PROFUN_16348 [Planoprotostelium fungivorum]
MTTKRFGLTLRANRTDTIDRVSTDTKTEKALKRYGILYIEQLIQADSKKYNKWTFQLQKAIRKIVRFESHNTRIESPEHLEICTDGSLYKGIASYGVAVIGHDEMNIGRRITGAQEINHAERRGILRAITQIGAAHNLTIYSDSFNSVLFCTKGGRLITENTRENVRRMMNNLSTEDWRDRQRVWSVFFTCHADPRSLPKKKEPYSNLITKIMTGTIWTNKRKKQYNLTEDDSCKFCSDIMEESIMDSHQHALGECIFTRELNDQLWATLKHFRDKSNIRTENILPWFSTSDYDQYEWNLPEEMGNKGLIPRNLRRKISKENKGLNTNSIILATVRIIRRHIISTYLYRQAMMET